MGTAFRSLLFVCFCERCACMGTLAGLVYLLLGAHIAAVTYLLCTDHGGRNDDGQGRLRARATPARKRRTRVHDRAENWGNVPRHAAAKRGQLERAVDVFLRGSKVRFIIVPDMLKNAPMFKKL